MNEEIKEILDGFKEILDNPTTSDECYDGRIIVIDRSYDLDLDEIKLLLDYITNLQNENEFLKLNNPEMNIEHFRIVKENKRKIDNLRKENERLNNIIDDKKERQEIAIRLLHKLFGTDDYEINYIIGIINGQRQIKFDEELKEGKNGRL